MRLQKSLTLQILPVLVVVTGVTGCAPTRPLQSLTAPGVSNAKPSQLSPSEIVSQASVDELVQLLDASQLEAEKLSELLVASTANRAARLSALERHIGVGVAAAEKLALHTEATNEHQTMAIQRKLSLLYQGAKVDRHTYLSRLKGVVSELKDTSPSSPFAAVGGAFVVELEYLTLPLAGADHLPALLDYAQNYQQHAAGVALFQKYGEQLERAGRPADAVACYRAGIGSYQHLAAAEALKSRLAKLERSEQGKQRAAQVKQDKLSRIRSQLGADDDGYFVIYAHEVKSPSGGFTMYSFEYEVLRGADATVAYISGLRANWQWELVKRYPETPESFRLATALAEQLTKKRAFIKY